MDPILRALTPKTSADARVAVAALAWSCVGAGLSVAGARWLLDAGGARAAAGVAVSLALGGVKARFVLAPMARANVARIREAGEGRCLGGVYPWRTWALVAGFAAAGTVLRRSPLPRYWLGVLYAAVGTALLAASAAAWSAWREGRAGDSAGPPGPRERGGPPA